MLVRKCLKGREDRRGVLGGTRALMGKVLPSLVARALENRVSEGLEQKSTALGWPGQPEHLR